MIRSSYIHEFDMFDELTNVINENTSSTNYAIQDYVYNCDKIKLMSLNESVEDSYFTEGAKELVERVGRGIRSIIDKLISLIENVTESFNQYLWSKKADIQKAEIILNKYPNYKNKIQFAIDNGDIEIKDIKSLQEVVDGSYDILSKLKDKKIEPSEAEKKFNAIIEKYNKYGKPIVEIVGGVGTVVGAIAAINKLYPELMKNRIDAGKYKRKLKEIQIKAEIDANEVGKQPGIAGIKNRIVSGMASIINKNLTASNSLFNRFGRMISSILSKADTSPSKSDLLKKRDKAEKDTETYLSIVDRSSLTNKQRESYISQRGKNKADKEDGKMK